MIAIHKLTEQLLLAILHSNLTVRAGRMPSPQEVEATKIKFATTWDLRVNNISGTMRIIIRASDRPYVVNRTGVDRTVV